MTASAIPGSFRDPSARVFECDGEILRGVDRATFDNFLTLREQPFYRALENEGAIVRTEPATGPNTEDVKAEGWHGVLRHERIASTTYPYEWTFSMLKDATLLQLDILEQCLKAGWVLKDFTPYNIQFAGSRAVFIDIPSFVPREAGAGWLAYRQFCMLNLYPLMLKAQLGIDFNSHLRANLDGIAPAEFARYFSGLRRFKRGVVSHVLFPAMMERAVEKRERDGTPTRGLARPYHSDAMMIGLVQSIRRLVTSLKSPIGHTKWSHYEHTHSYDASEHEAKKTFVTNAIASGQHWRVIWDIGCNTGDFTRICAKNSNIVIATDADHDTVETLFLRERGRSGTNITPLVMNVSNPSPDQGWAGKERRAFDARNRPDLVMCLALLHHVSLGANVPIPMFLDWLRSLGASVIVEFVDRHDEMVEKLLAQKQETYPEYTREIFDTELRKRFLVHDEMPLKGNKRHIYFCGPLSQ